MNDLKGWSVAYVGKWARETWTHESGLIQIADRSAGWGRSTPRPYIVSYRDRAEQAFRLCRHLGTGYYATAEAAIRAAERLFSKGARDRGDAA